MPTAPSTKNPTGGLPRKGALWDQFIIDMGGTATSGCFVTNAKNALAARLSLTEAQVLKLSIQDLWLRYAEAGYPTA